MHPMDRTLQQSLPTVMAPRFAELSPLEANGERLIAAANGIFLEARRPWIRIVRRIAEYRVPTDVPYGAVEETTDLLCGRIPADLVGDFAKLAADAMPNEVGAWIVWNSEGTRFSLVPVKILSHGPGHLDYERPKLAPAESLVMDLHSHGRLPAFFSTTDNADDRYDVKFAFVLGNCTAATPSMALRLCAKGILEEVERIPAEWYRAARREEPAV
ncbi:PRTRC system protein A [Cupriavidus sp. WS]|uniref:PRTRC system protein A n=1 Tax=Cupriavidus sp. WS TaxID=1312922 RepID=UPI00037D813E|nr:PRTRC system protein A [Cupriavidus sp. WS]